VASSPTQRNNPKRGPGDPWFVIGDVDVNTSILIPLLIVIIWVGVAVSGKILAVLWLSRSAYRTGFIWQLATWPFASIASVNGALGLFFFWSFGRIIEQQLAPSRYLRFLGMITVVTGGVALLLDLVIQDARVVSLIVDGRPGLEALASSRYLPILVGPSVVALAVAVCVAAEFPHIRTFFNIPIRVLVGAFFAIEVLRTVGDRYWLHLLHVIVAVISALALLRSFGMGTELPSWIPHVRLPSLITGDPYKRTATRGPSRPSGKSSGKTGDRSGRGGKVAGRFSRGSSGGGKVVSGPWGESGTGSATPAATTGVSSAPIMSRTDREDVDRLLDKIAKDGMASLSADERAQLEAASRRLRDNGQR
jgi:hypothetical protein